MHQINLSKGYIYLTGNGGLEEWEFDGLYYTEEIPAKGHHYENGECTDCGESDPSHTHSYDEGVVTKEPTCTEKGEKTFTCSECEHTYTEDVEALGHDYPDNSVWENTSNGSYAFVQEGTKWISNNGGIQSSTATSTWTITLDKDTEYSFKYKVSSEANYDKLTITLDSTTIANAISGAGEEITYTDTLAAGIHTLTATYAKDSSGNKNDDCGYVILEEIPGFTITKEPTCTEKGEKSFTCSRCGHIHTEEIPATGHNYISNVIWESTNNGSYKFVQSGNKWTSNNKGVQSSTATSTWTINLANDAEYSFRYKVSSEPNCDKLTITLDSTTVANAVSGAGTEQTYTTTLTAGTHTLTASYVKDRSQDKNDDCGYIILEDTANNMVITKEPTCTEKGEKTFTCSRCGHIYTEEIPAIGHNYENHVCTNCGETDPNHEHQWKANEDVLEWVRYNPYGRAGWTKKGNTYEASFSADKTDATKSASIEFDIEVPNDVECTYSFTCPYLYKTDFMYYDSAWAFLYDLDDSGNTIDTASNPRTTIFDKNGAGWGNSSGTISLSKGKHRLSVSYHKMNKSSAVSGTVSITLSSMTALNHVCTGCGQKVEHNYTETVTKEATCVESGERKYTCETCGYSYTEEIEATGEHNYVNGICTVCGDLNTGVEQIFNVSATTTKQSATSATNPDGHYEVTTLADTYSDNIEILEDMQDGEYLGINYYVYFPSLGGTAYYGESDNLNGLWQIQKYNAETDVWENYYQKIINYDNIKGVEETEDRFNLNVPHGRCFFKKFNLETGTYRVHCRFYAKSGMCDSYNHPHYDCNVIASLCQINRN